MNDNVIRLYPPPAEEQLLEGLYLAQDLRLLGEKARPFVYTNFITSLDGRISEPDLNSRRQVPAALANPHDWRLYMELAAQADVLLTTERHLRAVAAGRQGNLISLSREHPDLVAWRKKHGLPEQPTCAAISPSLAINAPALRECYSGPILVITGKTASAKDRSAFEAAGIEVICAGTSPRLSGTALIETLAGYAHIYSIAGPQVLHTLLEADVLDRLYLTLTQVILGGEQYDTLTRGPAFNPPRGFKLHELYFDPHAPANAGQFFISFNRHDDRASQ